MHFEITHTFDADLATVEHTLFDDPELPGFLMRTMTLVQGIEPLERRDDGQTVHRRVKYQPLPVIKKIGPREVPAHWMAWIEESTYDRQSHRMQFANLPTLERVRSLMENRGTLVLEAAGPGTTRRTLRGELTVKVFLLGAIAESLIHQKAVELLDEEAAAVRRFLQGER
jgi:hypothetical protein